MKICLPLPIEKGRRIWLTREELEGSAKKFLAAIKKGRDLLPHI